MFTLLGLCLHQIFFGKRCEGNPNLTYLTAEDFEDLRAEPIAFPNEKGETLRGYLYTSKNTVSPKGIVVFCHGMWGGHLSYTTEMNTFAEAGYTVLAYDVTGTMASDGKKLGGFTHPISDLQCALEFIETRRDLDPLDILLVGHSWGAYTVMMGSSFLYDRLRGAVAISGPDTALAVFLSYFPKWLRPLARPGIALALRIKEGSQSRYACADTMYDADVPVLLVHGTKDKTVPLGASPLSKDFMEECDHVYAHYCEGKYHNPYATVRAETELKEKVLTKKYDEIDYAIATEEDPEVMHTILTFMDYCLKD